MNESGDMDALAAEYVLGTLESGERAQALALTTIDPGFVEKIRFWEQRLSELHLMVEPIEPDAKIWERIKPKLPATAQAAETQPPEAEPPKPVEGAEEATPSGVFDELPTSAPAGVPAAPHLPPVLIPEEPAAASKPTPPPVPVPTPAVATPLIPERAAVSEPRPPAVPKRGHPGLWKAFAVLMTLIVLALAGLVAAWRYVPERVPPQLRPLEVMRVLGVAIPVGPPPRPPAPPESQYDE
jgi:hypothetical protein